jgi:hypothetical protein
VASAVEFGLATVEPIDWKLITDLPVTSRAQAIEKLNWYAQRWKIETFDKILKIPMVVACRVCIRACTNCLPWSRQRSN